MIRTHTACVALCLAVAGGWGMAHVTARGTLTTQDYVEIQQLYNQFGWALDGNVALVKRWKGDKGGPDRVQATLSLRQIMTCTPELIKAMAEATMIVLVGCYYGYTASGGPVGVGTATAKSMVLNLVGVHLIGMLGTQLFWGANPRAPIGG